jgi:chromosome transmission fidelity protein 18
VDRATPACYLKIYIFQVNSQVIKPQERALLLRLVDIMVSFELRFVQEKAEDGQNVYRLDP